MQLANEISHSQRMNECTHRTFASDPPSRYPSPSTSKVNVHANFCHDESASRNVLSDTYDIRDYQRVWIEDYSNRRPWLSKWTVSNATTCKHVLLEIPGTLSRDFRQISSPLAEICALPEHSPFPSISTVCRKSTDFLGSIESLHHRHDV